MRLRIQTVAPLPPLKAWFTTDSLDVQIATVSGLKRQLCTRLQALKDAFLKGQSGNLVLTLDDFELLDDCTIGVVRDGDLICVGLVPGELRSKSNMGVEDLTRIKKRKRSTSASVPAVCSQTPKITVVAKSRHHIPLSSSSSESDSDDSSSSSSSSSSSTSDSSSSDPDTSSSDSDSGPPTPQPSKLPKPVLTLKSNLQPQTAIRTIKLPTVTAPLVPPGHGKPQTHSRNIRKRLKRKHDASGLQLSPPPPPRGSSSINLVPLGNRPPQMPRPLQQLNSLPTTPSGKGKIPNTDLTSTGKKKKTKRDVAGPGADVAYALNNAFGTNAEIGTMDPLAASGGPLGSACVPSAEAGMDVDIGGQGEVMMASLRNKNKKKGFKYAFTGPLPRKIVFGEGESSSAHANGPTPSLPSSPHTTGADGQEHNQSDLCNEEVIEIWKTGSRLIPPSEKQDNGNLPKNVFVTSVDVEAGMWGKKARKAKEKSWVSAEDDGTKSMDMADIWAGEAMNAEDEEVLEINEREWQGDGIKRNGRGGSKGGGTGVMDGAGWMDGAILKGAEVAAVSAGNNPAAKNNTTADIDEPMDDNVMNAVANGEMAIAGSREPKPQGPGFNWELAERGWDRYVEVKVIEQLHVGGLVGWKALAINPSTFTPEFLLTVARVINTTPSIAVKPLIRPGAAQISFSSRLGAGGEEDDGRGDEREQGGEEHFEVHEWGEITGAGWRLIAD